jgi:chemotaxis protein methyltransferase CheR
MEAATRAASGAEAQVLTDDELRLWSDFIGQCGGWTFGRSRAHVLARALHARLEALGCASLRAYYEFVSADRDGMTEVPHLVELIVNQETSFFRNEALFKVLVEKVFPDLRERGSATGTINVLSAGCSKGQEAYSIALAMANDEIWRTRDIVIWGTDISRRALKAAREARYSQEEIDAIPRQYRGLLQATLVNNAMIYEIPAAIRDHVRFVCANLVAPGESGLTYDLILCQNVLFYFTARASALVVDQLCSRLAPGGYLFLGAGEAADRSPAGVEIVPFPQACAFRRPL